MDIKIKIALWGILLGGASAMLGTQCKARMDQAAVPQIKCIDGFVTTDIALHHHHNRSWMDARLTDMLHDRTFGRITQLAYDTMEINLRYQVDTNNANAEIRCLK